MPEPVVAYGKATGITGAFPPLREPSTNPEHDGQAQDEPVDDKTIVVPRAKAVVWELVLPSGESYELASDVVIGRRPDAIDGSAVLVIPDPTRTLSKSHVRMRYDGERWTVEDLGSTNGLVLLPEGGDEQELEPHREVAAVERMLFGTLEVQLRRGGDAA